MNGRDLHAALKIGRDYPTWVKAQIEKAGVIEGKEYVKISSNINFPQTGEAENKEFLKPFKIKMPRLGHPDFFPFVITRNCFGAVVFKRFSSVGFSCHNFSKS